MRISRTIRRLPKETLQLERRTGRDGQGKPSYASPVDFDANVVEYDAEKADQFVMAPDGSRVATPFTLYIAGDATEVPGTEDRLTLPDDRVLIAMEKKTVAGLGYTASQPDHYRIRAKVE